MIIQKFEYIYCHTLTNIFLLCFYDAWPIKNCSTRIRFSSIRRESLLLFHLHTLTFHSIKLWRDFRQVPPILRLMLCVCCLFISERKMCFILFMCTFEIISRETMFFRKYFLMILLLRCKFAKHIRNDLRVHILTLCDFNNFIASNFSHLFTLSNYLCVCTCEIYTEKSWFVKVKPKRFEII